MGKLRIRSLPSSKFIFSILSKASKLIHKSFLTQCQNTETQPPNESLIKSLWFQVFPPSANTSEATSPALSKQSQSSQVHSNSRKRKTPRHHRDCGASSRRRPQKTAAREGHGVDGHQARGTHTSIADGDAERDRQDNAAGNDESQAE